MELFYILIVGWLHNYVFVKTQLHNKMGILCKFKYLKKHEGREGSLFAQWYAACGIWKQGIHLSSWVS